MPRPPTPPGSSPHKQQGPHERLRPSTTPAGSPHEQQGPSTPRGSSPHEQQGQSTPRGSSPHEQQSPHLPEGGPSASPPSQHPPRERAPVKRNGTPPRKIPRLERTQPPLEKLPWERPDEENDVIVRSQVAAHFAKKVPEIPFEKTIDPVKVVRTVENLYNPEQVLSDYERTIEMSYDEMVGVKKGAAVVQAEKGKQVVESKKRKQVPQLGEQPVQSVPPLKVLDDQAVQSRQQQTTDTDYAFLEVAYQFVQGKNLVENVSTLPTRLRNLHSWYLNRAKEGFVAIMVGVKEEHYFQEYAVSVDFVDLFALYNLRALDKSLLSCYCL